MKILICLYISLFLISCSSPETFTGGTKNRNFASALNEYYNYLDSLTIRPDTYIIVSAESINDTLLLSIHLGGGAYNFFHKPVIDFVHYKNRDILLVGDFPNEIIKIKKTKESNIENIVKERYPDDYKEYLIDKSSVGPIMGDYMKMILIFKKDRLMSFKRQYY